MRASRSLSPLCAGVYTRVARGAYTKVGESGRCVLPACPSEGGRPPSGRSPPVRQERGKVRLSRCLGLPALGLVLHRARPSVVMGTPVGSVPGSTLSKSPSKNPTPRFRAAAASLRGRFPPPFGSWVRDAPGRGCRRAPSNEAGRLHPTHRRPCSAGIAPARWTGTRRQPSRRLPFPGRGGPFSRTSRPRGPSQRRGARTAPPPRQSPPWGRG